MIDLEALMLMPEQFPLRLYPNKFGGWDVDDSGIIPPYHPSMQQNGINFESIPDLIYHAFQTAIRDLEGVADKVPWIKGLLDPLERDAFGKVIFSPEVIKNSADVVAIGAIPIFEQVFVGRATIDPYGIGDQGISISPRSAPKTFTLPSGVLLTADLLAEYQMTPVPGTSLVKCSSLWFRHTVSPTNAVLYKNLVMALDNDVVAQKYAAN